MPLVRSTQKLPMVPRRSRVNPRTRAIATANPTAADAKFCTARPAICVRCDIVDSPAYDCQLVLVMKLAAVFQAMLAGTAGMWVGLRPSTPCRRSKAYSTTSDAALKATTEIAYTFQRCSLSGSIRQIR